jgi:DNA-binding NarL/FixJ family response regulator
MRSAKRVILADGSRLLREMLNRVIEKADHLQVVEEISQPEKLFSAIERLDPEWVIVSRPYSDEGHGWVRSCLDEHPSVRFVFLSPHQTHIKMKWQMSCEEDYPDLSLKEFIGLLEKDLQLT